MFYIQSMILKPAIIIAFIKIILTNTFMNILFEYQK